LHDLESLGWNESLAEAFQPFTNEGFVAARIAVEHRGAYILYAATGELTAAPTGRLRHEAQSPADLPAVGDWVAVRPVDGGRAAIEAVLPRRSKFSRKVPWTPTEEQVVAANADTVFIVSGLGHDLNLRRLERYLTVAWESGADPAIVLTKADVWPNVDAAVADAETVALGVPIHALSAVTGEGVDQLAPHLRAGRTVALLGSSGVGKSTLVNHLLGYDLLATREVRADGRGRHTTSHRQLIMLPGGALVIDTPGMRELQLWETPHGLEASFDDVATLARECRFSDCAHETEPGCAVRSALERGVLDTARLASFRQLQRELRRLELRASARLRSEERKKRSRAARQRRRPKLY
jgi:ribosome biogenesis GTPase / thiamine phosphate phosphatase